MANKNESKFRPETDQHFPEQADTKTAQDNSNQQSTNQSQGYLPPDSPIPPGGEPDLSPDSHEPQASDLDVNDPEIRKNMLDSELMEELDSDNPNPQPQEFYKYRSSTFARYGRL